jgi:Protein of unknown function (DUF2829)
VNFSDALRELKQGRRVTRKLWGEQQPPLTRCYLQLLDPPAPDWMPVLMVRCDDQGIWRPFAGACWDLLAEDWEVTDPDLVNELSGRDITIMREAMSEGVTLSSADWSGGEVSALHWRPGDPNPLARVILTYVTEDEMPLELDGHRYLVRKERS